MTVKLPPGVVINEKPVKLTAKQSAFIDEYLIDFNATQAAIRAGYSEKTAQQISHELLLKPVIIAEINKRRQQRSERTKIDADWVLRRLAAESDADIADLYEDDGQLKSVHDWPLVWRQGLVSGIEVEELFEGRGAAKEQIGVLRKIKLSDRVKRLELVGKHVGVQAFRDQVHQTGEVVLQVTQDDAEL